MKAILLILISFSLISCETIIDERGRFIMNTTGAAGGSAGIRVYSKASKWEGRHYRKGKTAQCANYVAHVVREAGMTPPSGSARCVNWLKWGKKVNGLSNVRKGDIVIYTRRDSYNHIGIATGNGTIIHRPTYSKSVRKAPIAYRSILAIRRPL